MERVNNANGIRFRASSIKHLMTEPKSKAAKEKGELSESAKTHLVDIFVSAKYGRQSDIANRYIEKGLEVEDDSITLYSRVSKTFYKKNEDRLTNDFITGLPDLYEGDSIEKANLVIDIKSSWDIFTFFRTQAKGINEMYYWQLQAYMGLTGAKKAKLAYCLIDTPHQLLMDEKRKLVWKMGVLDTDPLYLEACEKLDLLHTYGDIPLSERLYEIEIERDDDAIMQMYANVMKARDWMNLNLFKL